MSLESRMQKFVAIVDHGSVSAAARELGVARASLSRHLAELEEEFGVRLIHRDTHRQVLTDAGTELYGRARKMVSDLDDARRALRRLDDVPRGKLRVGMPPDSDFEVPIATMFAERFDEVQLEFVNEQQHVDLLSNALHVAIRGGELADASLMARRLVSVTTGAFASKSYLEKHPIRTLDDLKSANCLGGYDRLGRPRTTWPLWEGGSIAVSGGISTNSPRNQVRAAQAGLGVAYAAHIDAVISTGDLVPVLPDLVGYVVPLSVVWPSSEFMDPKVRAFIDIAVEYFSNL